MLAPLYNVHTAAYHSAYDSSTYFFKVTTGVNTAQRLGTLLTVPQVTNEMVQTAVRTQPVVAKRPPWHVIFQVPVGAANPVYMTWDNNTTPVVGGPGYEILPGAAVRFENAGVRLLNPSSVGNHQVNALTAFQFIATAATVLLVHFSD